MRPQEPDAWGSQMESIGSVGVDVDGLTKSVSHHLETVVETYLRWGIESFHGFLGGANWISFIHSRGLVNLLFDGFWFSEGGNRF